MYICPTESDKEKLQRGKTTDELLTKQVTYQPF